jgi:hypothetical protein
LFLDGLESLDTEFFHWRRYVFPKDLDSLYHCWCLLCCMCGISFVKRASSGSVKDRRVIELGVCLFVLSLLASTISDA